MRADSHLDRSYLLGNFQFFPDERLVVCLLDGRKIWLHPLESQLLELLAKSPNKILSKENISMELWNVPASREIEKRIRQTIFVIRRALGKDLIETGLNEGYRLAVEATFGAIPPTAVLFEPTQRFGWIPKYWIFIAVESILYSLSCALPLFVETAFKREFWSIDLLGIAITVLPLSLTGSLLSFTIIDKLVNRNKPTLGLTAGILSIVFCASIVALIGFGNLPDIAITETFLHQAQTAQFAYVKSVFLYSLPVFIAAVVMPFYSIALLDNRRSTGSITTSNESFPTDAEGLLNLNVPTMLVLLALFFLFATYSMFYLLDNLRPSKNQSAFSFLLIARNINYFLIAIFGTWWYFDTRKQIEAVYRNRLKEIAPSTLSSQ